MSDDEEDNNNTNQNGMELPELMDKYNGGFHASIIQDEAANAMIKFNNGTNNRILPVQISSKKQYIQNIGIATDLDKLREQRLIEHALRHDSIPTVKEWIPMNYRLLTNPLTNKSYLVGAQECVLFCFRVARTTILDKVLQSKGNSMKLKKYQASVRIGVTASAIIGCCYGFVKPPETTLAAIANGLGNDEKSKHYKFFHEYVMCLCRYIFGFIFPCIDSVKWDSVNDFNVSNFKSTHGRKERGELAIWSNAYMQKLEIGGEKAKDIKLIIRGHNFEMAKLIDAVVPGFWNKLKMMEGYLLPEEIPNDKWEINIFNDRLYAWNKDGNHKVFIHATKSRESRDKKLKFMQTALNNELPWQKEEQARKALEQERACKQQEKEKERALQEKEKEEEEKEKEKEDEEACKQREIQAIKAGKQQEETLKQQALQSQRKRKKTGSISEEKQQEMTDDSSVNSMEMNSNGKRQRGVTQSPN